MKVVSISKSVRQDIVFERFILPIVLKPILNNEEAKTSEGDRPSPPKAESEDTISCLYMHSL